MEILRALVRPVVTFAITAIFGYGLVKALIPWEAGLPIITMVFIFWFEGKSIERAIEKVLGKREESGEFLKVLAPYMSKLMDYLITIEKPKKGGKE